MSDDGVQQEYLYKILVVGDIGTGKTSIIKRFVHNIFSSHYKSTIGVDFALKVLHWDPHTEVRLQLWDIAGQERFGNMTRVYYKEAVGAFVVFDVTRQATFDAVAQWKADIDAKVTCDQKTVPFPLFFLSTSVIWAGRTLSRQRLSLASTASSMDSLGGMRPAPRRTRVSTRLQRLLWSTFFPTTSAVLQKRILPSSVLL